MRTQQQIEADIAALEAEGDNGCCMCGDYADDHGWPEHMPIKMYDYYMNLLRDEMKLLKAMES